MPDLIRHRSLPISAPRAYWVALGWQTYSNSDQAGNHPVFNMDGLLAMAAATGHQGEEALAWAVGEHQRQVEEKTRATAVAREAEAISALAQSLRSEADTAVLERIMSRLSEPTRWAVRKQLSGSGMLSPGT